MRPIVNGLEAVYGDRVDFYYLDAEDGGPGQQAFEFYQLRGHPAVLVARPGGEIYQTLSGVRSAEEVEQALDAVLVANE